MNTEAIVDSTELVVISKRERGGGGEQTESIKVIPIV